MLPEELNTRLLGFRHLGESKPESGGIILGHRRGNHLEATSITVPLPLDSSSSVSFNRVDPGHQRRATSLWRSSGQSIDYVGEWHTHPQVVPTPSEIDISEWARFRNESRSMIGIIVGRSGLWVGDISASTPISLVLVR